MYLFMKNTPFLDFINHTREHTREKTDIYREGCLHQLSAILKNVKHYINLTLLRFYAKMMSVFKIGEKVYASHHVISIN